MAAKGVQFELSQVVQGKGRVGVLKSLVRSGQHSLDTPGCLLYTHLGTVPHLTQDTLHTIKHLPAVSQVSLSAIAEHQEVLDEFKGGFRKFAGLHDTLLYCSIHDPAAPFPTGYATNKTVSVWGSGGRMELTVAKYMALVKSAQPDWYQGMADGETWQRDTSRKRVRKSVDRTLAHLDECLLLHQNSPELEGAAVFGVLEGGDILDERLRSARETAKRPVSGFCLDGLQTGSMDQALRTELLSAVTTELPEDKPRLLQGVGRPDEVLACVEAGVDLFEGFFPFQATERGCALSFSFNICPDPESTVLGQDEEENPLMEPNGEVHPEDQTQMTTFEINLKDKSFEDDFGPLVEGCGCYCCRNHKRAYIHHLLVTNELLAGVLLMVHNTVHYQGFFRALRDALVKDQLDVLKRQVLGRGRAQTVIKE